MASDMCPLCGNAGIPRVVEPQQEWFMLAHNLGSICYPFGVSRPMVGVLHVYTEDAV